MEKNIFPFHFLVGRIILDDFGKGPSVRAVRESPLLGFCAPCPEKAQAHAPLPSLWKHYMRKKVGKKEKISSAKKIRGGRIAGVTVRKTGG
jgi:hypothetical protein